MSISKEQMTAMLSGRDRFKCGLSDFVPVNGTAPQMAQDGADTRKGVGVLVVHNGKLLCATRRKEGTICGPGGHIEEGESPEDAAVRETQEEFGITPLDLIPLAELTGMPKEYCDSQVYLCTEYGGTISCDDEEMTRPGFITVDMVQQLAEQSPERLFQPFSLSVEKFVQLILTPDQQKDTMKDGEISTDGGAGSGNFGHKGVPGQLGGSAPSGKNDVTAFQRSGSTITVTSDISIKRGKYGKATMLQGKISKVEDFAGVPGKKPVVVEEHLIKQYGGKPGTWRHTKGFAKIRTKDGTEKQAEIHWFENDDVGQIKWKIKREL